MVADPCVACTTGEEPDRARSVVLDVEATFEGGGSGSGRIAATHCASMDLK